LAKKLFLPAHTQQLRRTVTSTAAMEIAGSADQSPAMSE
jgi:hypothetical protein